MSEMTRREVLGGLAVAVAACGGRQKTKPAEPSEPPPIEPPPGPVLAFPFADVHVRHVSPLILRLARDSKHAERFLPTNELPPGSSVRVVIASKSPRTKSPGWPPNRVTFGEPPQGPHVEILVSGDLTWRLEDGTIQVHGEPHPTMRGWELRKDGSYGCNYSRDDWQEMRGRKGA